MTLLFATLLSTAGSAADVQGALKFVPADSMAVAGIDLDALRKTPWVNKMFMRALQQAGRQELQELESAAGIKVDRDIHSLVMAFDKSFPNDDDQFVMILEAKLDETGVVAFIRKEGDQLKREQGLGGHFYVVDNGKAGLAFRGKYTIIGGLPMFKRALLGAPPGANDLAKLRHRVDRRHAFLAAKIPQDVQQQLGQEMPEMGDVRHAVASLNVVGPQLRFDVDAGFSNPKSPSKIAALLNQQLKKAAEERMAKELGLREVMLRTQIRSVGHALKINLTVNKQTLEALAAKL